MRPHGMWLLVLATACSGETASEACGERRDGCPPGDICIDGACRTVCVNETDCTATGETCIEGACRPTFCVIDGGDVLASTVDPTDPCRTCQPNVDTASYSPVVDGSTCDDGLFCTVNETCQSGTCTSDESPCDPTTPFCSETAQTCVCTPTSCDDGAWCNGEEFCAATGECGPGTAVVCESPETPVCSDTAEACVECDSALDCEAPNPSCVNYICTPCPTCACPLGEHDGGDGECVPEGLCSSGFTRAWPDYDEDGYTTALSDDCVRETPLPDGWLAGPSSPPLRSWSVAAVDEDNSFGDRRWDDSEEAIEIDGVGARCKPDDNRDCRYLVLTDLELGLPETATIEGIAVHVVRWADEDATRTLADASVRLVIGGNAAGEDRADTTTAWPFAAEEVVYGGPADLWGLTLTPADVADPQFGVAFSAKVLSANDGPEAWLDGLWVEIFVADAVDCDDNDPAIWALQSGGLDLDGDGWAGGDQATCIGATLPADFAVRSGDCYDDAAAAGAADAHPGQTSYFAADRGDGSWDYDCDEAETKASMFTHDSCQCTTVCTYLSRTNLAPPPASCGDPQSIYTCTGTCPTCNRTASSPAVRCR